MLVQGGDEGGTDQGRGSGEFWISLGGRPDGLCSWSGRGD